MKNEYGQNNKECANYNNKCNLDDYKGTCVICKGQYCRRFKNVNDNTRYS